MASVAFLQTRPNVTVDLKVPSRYPRAGFYPTRWAIRFDTGRGEYRVELTDFVSRS